MTPEPAWDRLGPGMRAQLAAFREARARGMPRAGWKIGLNFPDLRRKLGLSTPVLGWLRGDLRLESGGRFAPAEGSRLFVEAEVAVRIARPVAADTPVEQAGGRVDALAPALELVDFARSWDGIGEILGHSIFHAGWVLGEPRAPEVAAELGARWPQVWQDGTPVREARGDLVPANLGESVAFAAAFLAAFGEELAAGDWLLAGSYVDPLPARAGARIEARYGPLGRVAVHLEAPGEV